MFDRALGSYDQFAGRLLENATVTQHGSDRIARSGKLAHLVTLEREAAQRREAADAAARSGQKARQADQRAADGLREAEATEREGKKAAAEHARSIAERKKEQADARAHDRAGAIEDELEHTAAADACITAAQQDERERLDEAAQQRSAAADKRSDADQLGTLADKKRQNRKTS